MSRRGYLIALVAAVAVLLGSMALTALVVAGQRLDRVAIRWDGIDGRRGGGPGMMNPRQGGQAQVSLAEAQQIASDWLSANQPGAVLGTGFTMPRGYVFPVTRDGVRVGTLLVSDRDGQVSYRQFATPAPTPTPSATA
jgi:hypothetical protein